MSISRVTKLLERSNSPERNFPPTDLYNEGWMLRLVLDWLSSNPGIEHELSFVSTDKWYSEALLPSAFLAKVQGDNLAEAWTHADGVIGDFIIGANRDGDLTLVEGASRILVTEAKMFSKLSAGVKNASYFDQAARNVACIAEAICRAQISPRSLKKVGFYIIAPESQINKGIFAKHITPNSIQSIVSLRASEYQDPEKDKWLKNWFMPTLERIRIKEISWEELVNLVKQHDSIYGEQIEAFYQNCLKFNNHAR